MIAEFCDEGNLPTPAATDDQWLVELPGLFTTGSC
jgi:hypothetical protein